MRKICVITGTRAEFGLLYCTIKAIEEDKDLQLQFDRNWNASFPLNLD